MSNPSMFEWIPTQSPEVIWKAFQQYPWCCIFDSGDWRFSAVAEHPKWTIRTHDWRNLPDPVPSPSSTKPNNTPKFTNGILSIISYDGVLHAWRPEYTLAFHAPTQRWYIFGVAGDIQRIETHIQDNLSNTTSSPPNDSKPLHTSSMSEQQYCEAVDRTRAEIEAGNVYQINLSHQIGPVTLPDPLQTWLRLTQRNPATHGCYWQTPDEVLICNSPEQFLSFTPDGIVRSTPIKGTHRNPNAPNAIQELRDSEKERAELTMIVDMMRNDISKTAQVGSVIAHPRTIRRCGDLLHAEQTVEGSLRDKVTQWQALYACFPPASITGAPKRAAMELIQALEPVNRGWYTGSFGWRDDDGHAEWNVLIRTIQCSPKDSDGSVTGFYNIGAGIVYDSDPAAEWQETLAKGRAIAAVLSE